MTVLRLTNWRNRDFNPFLPEGFSAKLKNCFWGRNRGTRALEKDSKSIYILKDDNLKFRKKNRFNLLTRRRPPREIPPGPPEIPKGLYIGPQADFWQYRLWGSGFPSCHQSYFSILGFVFTDFASPAIHVVQKRIVLIVGGKLAYVSHQELRIQAFPDVLP